MHLDVVRLRDFYSSALGAATARLLSARIREFWPTTTGLAVAGLGYAAPVLRVFDDTARTIAVMPGSQGVHAWPIDKNRTTIAYETALPFADESIDRLILVHFIETTEDVRPALREIWRVLVPGGRLLTIVPNRGGTWALTDRTPFGHGRPFSRSQLELLLTDHMLTPLLRGSSLFMPPFKSRAGVQALLAAERLGQRWWSNLGGLLIMEAEKRIYAEGTPAPAKAQTLRRAVPVANSSRSHVKSKDRP